MGFCSPLERRCWPCWLVGFLSCWYRYRYRTGHRGCRSLSAYVTAFGGGLMMGIVRRGTPRGKSSCCADIVADSHDETSQVSEELESASIFDDRQLELGGVRSAECRRIGPENPNPPTGSFQLPTPRHDWVCGRGSGVDCPQCLRDRFITRYPRTYCCGCRLRWKGGLLMADGRFH